MVDNVANKVEVEGRFTFGLSLKYMLKGAEIAQILRGKYHGVTGDGSMEVLIW